LKGVWLAEQVLQHLALLFWRGQEIPRTVFEIAVSDGPLSPDEKRCLLKPGAGTVAPATGQSATNTSRAARPRLIRDRLGRLKEMLP
jgi:hypothetical protein